MENYAINVTAQQALDKLISCLVDHQVLIKFYSSRYQNLNTCVPNRKLHRHESAFVIIIIVVIVVVDKHQADDHYEGHRQEYTGVEKMFPQTEAFIESLILVCVRKYFNLNSASPRSFTSRLVKVSP